MIHRYLLLAGLLYAGTTLAQTARRSTQPDPHKGPQVAARAANTRSPLRYRATQWNTTTNAWDADSILGYAEEAGPNATVRAATVEYATGDSLAKAVYRYDGLGRNVFVQELGRNGTTWIPTYEEGNEYDPAGRHIRQHWFYYSGTGQPTSFSQQNVWVYDNLGRMTANAWYTWQSFSSTWHLQDSTLTRYANRIGIPDTTFTNSVIRKLHYNAYPADYNDTLVVTQLFNNNVWSPTNQVRYSYRPSGYSAYYFEYDRTLSRFKPTSEFHAYHEVIQGDSLNRVYEIQFHHGRRDSMYATTTRRDSQQRVTFNDNAFYDTTTHIWSHSYITINYIEQGGIMQRQLWHQGTDLAALVPYYKYDFFGPLATSARQQAGLRAWPNPGINQVRVEAVSPVISAALLDLSGHSVVSGTVAGPQATFDLTSLPPGSYQARLQTAGGVQVVRIGKE